MNRTYSILEKAISITLILSGIYFLWLSFDILYYKLDIVVRSNNNSYSDLSNYYYNYFRYFHLIMIMSIIAVISGISLFKRKKIGWILSTIVLIGFPLSVLLRNWLNPESDFHNPSYTTLFVIAITILVMLIGIALFTKPFKDKYNVNSTDLFYIVIAIGIIIIDTFIFKK